VTKTAPTQNNNGRREMFVWDWYSNIVG